MGCTTSKEEQENQKIQAAQRKAELMAAQVVKILILGSGDSGKTTFRKQLRVLYGEGFSPATRKQIAPVIVSNLLEGMRDILDALPELGLKLDSDDLVPASQLVLDTVALTEAPSFLSPALLAALRQLIPTSAVQQALERRHEFQLQDCWLTFAKELTSTGGTNSEWGTHQWTPNTEECVAARVRTSGVVEESLLLQGITFRFFDVGGQRNERKKWLHCYDQVSAVLFVTAMSEYDQVLFEDRSRNRMEEALALFEEIVNSRWFTSVPVILFLNKRDLFEEKFVERRIPLNVSGCFPDAPQGSQVTADQAIDWIKHQFLTRRENAQKPVYVHVTTATDASNIRVVFDVCQKIIIKSNLEKAGFILES